MAINIIGYGQKTAANPSLSISLVSGQAVNALPGQYQVGNGTYSTIQWYDPITTLWRPLVSSGQTGSFELSADGYNYRVANLTGTVVGAIVTNGGTATMTNGIYPANTGAAITATVTGTTTAFNVIVGGSVSTTVTVTAGGTGYTKVPTLLVSNPPTGGLPATMVATLTSGAISSVTVTNQGAGYVTAPTVTVLNGFGDTTGAGGVLTCALDSTNQGKITACTVGTSAASLTSVPSITFAGATAGSPAATAIMCVTATAVTWTGPNHGSNGNFGLIGSTVVAGSSTTTNPLYTTGLFLPRMGFTAYSTTGSPTTTTIVDGGIHQIAPNAVFVSNSDGTINASTTAAVTFGGVTDTIYGVTI